MTENNIPTKLSWSKDISASRGGLYRTVKAAPGSRYFLHDNLIAEEVENMVYDKDFNELTVIGQPGEIAVAYCTIANKPKFHYGEYESFDVIYLFEIRESNRLYPTLPIKPGKATAINVSAGQRFLLPADKPVDVQVLNSGESSGSTFSLICLEEYEGSPLLAVGVYPDGRTAGGNESNKVSCIITVGDEEPFAVVFKITYRQLTDEQRFEQTPQDLRKDLIRTAPNHYLVIEADEDSSFFLPSRLSIQHLQNASYDAKTRAITAHLKDGEKTRVFFKNASSEPDIALGIVEFRLMKKPQHPYLPPTREDKSIDCNAGDKFTLPDEDHFPEDYAYRFRVLNVVNARIQYIEGRAVLEIGVDENGNKIKGKRGTRKAMIVVDIRKYQPYVEMIQNPVLVTYTFKY